MGSRRINWFPGHMAKALTTLKQLTKGVDLVMEVRDARVPLSSANPVLAPLLSSRRHIIVLNKSDLVDSRDKRAALKHLEQQGALALATNSGNSSSVSKLLHTAVGWIERERRQSELSVMMVTGLPNSGKSSLINALKMAARQAGLLDGEQAFQKRATVGPMPGLTRQVSGFQVCGSPLTYVLDTPGIMVPAVSSERVGLNLALAGAIKDSIVGEEEVVKHLLHVLAASNKHRAALLKAILSSGSTTSSKAKSAGLSTNARRKLQHKLRDMRQALLDVSSQDVVTREGSYSAAAGSSSSISNLAAQEITASWAAAPAAAPYVHQSHKSNQSSRLISDEAAEGDIEGDTEGDVFPGDAPWWHPGQEDEGFDSDSVRLELLLERLGVSGANDASRQVGWYVRILQAFRAGELGKIMLDELPAAAAPVAAGAAAAEEASGSRRRQRN